MTYRQGTLAAALVLALAGGLAACGSAGSGGSATDQRQVSATGGKSGKLTVWVMDGDYSDAALKAINSEFTRQTGAKVSVQVQSWDDITTKVTTALSTANPPDVLDIGNTQVAAFAANGGLKDLTPYREDLEQKQTWLAGLVDPATVDGRLYGVPGFAGARAVIYNRTMWAKAGVTTAPTTYAELTADLDKVRAAHPAKDFSPFYYPGQNWYAGIQYVWDAGGAIATKKGSDWQPGLTSAAAQRGLRAFKAFQNTYSSPASRTVDVLTPDQTQVLADGKTSAIIATSGFVAAIEKANPKLTDSDLGTFPFPGTSGRNQPVFLGGSDWGIAAHSKNSELALAWTKIAASPGVQSTWIAGKEGFIPNSSQGITAAKAHLSALNKGFFEAALRSDATPASADWAQIEGDKDINALFSSIASGAKSPSTAAAAFDDAASKVLNSGR